MSNRPRLALLAFACTAHSASIRDVDFKNLTYPFDAAAVVPNRLIWMSRAGVLRLDNGAHAVPCDGDGLCGLVTLDNVDFGNLTALPGTSALVTLTFHTGGTATWQYLYVIAIRSGRPRVQAWLETGSRADMGLRYAAVDNGDLVLVVNDPEKREGDCCSTGTITYRYRWHNRSFHQVGAPILADDP